MGEPFPGGAADAGAAGAGDAAVTLAPACAPSPGPAAALLARSGSSDSDCDSESQSTGGSDASSDSGRSSGSDDSGASGASSAATTSSGSGAESRATDDFESEESEPQGGVRRRAARGGGASSDSDSDSEADAARDDGLGRPAPPEEYVTLLLVATLWTMALFAIVAYTPLGHKLPQRRAIVAACAVVPLSVVAAVRAHDACMQRRRRALRAQSQPFQADAERSGVQVCLRWLQWPARGVRRQYLSGHLP